MSAARFLAGLILALALLLVSTVHFMSKVNSQSKSFTAMLSQSSTKESSGSSPESKKVASAELSQKKVRNKKEQGGKAQLRADSELLQQKEPSTIAESTETESTEKNYFIAGREEKEIAFSSGKAEEKENPLGEAEKALLSLEKYFK